MTGFGRGEASANGITATVELKSLNSRYLDLSVRLPQRLQDKELALKELLQSSISRGKLNVSVHIIQKETGELNITYDEAKVKAYVDLLNKLKDTAGIDEEISIRNLTAFSDIFVTHEDDEDTLERSWKLVQEAAKQAAKALNVMRAQEGKQLKNDLIDRIQSIDDQIAEIITASETRVTEAREKLRERIRTLLEDENFDQDRLELEIAVLADKLDITEEIVRLRSHLKFFLEAVEEGALMGRRLNFLTQEINRELNTIGSKANNSAISHYVVKAKENLEQIREQVQNIE